MTSIDYVEPDQVFDRLAQIEHDTTKRLAAIDALTAAQGRADREFDRLQQLAMAYLEPRCNPVVTATAYDSEQTPGRPVEYCLTIIEGTVLVKPHAHTCDIGDLTAAEIAAALTRSAEGLPDDAGNE
jgi:hypothetical protein